MGFQALLLGLMRLKAKGKVMCGRFVNHLADMHRWAALLKGWPAGGALSYNVAPTTQVPLLTAQGSQVMSWGLVPAWSKEAKTQYATFNARLESAAEKPAFRNAWRAKRTCIVPMLGYYEWRVEGGKKQPYLVQHASQPLFVAGLWEPRQAASSFTLLTRPACENLNALHPRQPCVLPVEALEGWLQGDIQLMDEPPVQVNQYLDYYAVSTEVGSVRNDHERLIKPLEGDSEPDLFG